MMDRMMANRPRSLATSPSAGVDTSVVVDATSRRLKETIEPGTTAVTAFTSESLGVHADDPVSGPDENGDYIINLESAVPTHELAQSVSPAAVEGTIHTDKSMASAEPPFLASDEVCEAGCSSMETPVAKKRKIPQTKMVSPGKRSLLRAGKSPMHTGRTPKKRGMQQSPKKRNQRERGTRRSRGTAACISAGGIGTFKAHGAEINIAENQYNYHYHQQQTHDQAETNRENEKQKVEEFTKEVNKRSKEESESSIARDFDDDIQEPKDEVEPVLVKTNFYRGETVLDEVDYSVPDEGRRKPSKKKTREVEVHLKDVHKHGRYIMLVGAAGSGKTTLIKRYCAMLLDKQILWDEIKVVHLLNIRDLSKEKLTPKEMLFGKFLVGNHKKKLIKYGYEWMQKEENQERILLAFDGIDTAPWVLRDDTHDLINYDDKRSAITIIYNILHGHLFKKCKLLLTSREYGITGFPRSIRPEAVIALKGFTRKSIMILVKEFGGDKGDEIWESLKKKSVNLMLLCTTPLFLIFTIIVFKKYDVPPENLSGIIITIIESHIHSLHKRVSDEKIRDIIQKLKVLSLKGLKDGKVVFFGKEFKELGIDLKDVKDLIISAPSPAQKIPSQRLLEEDYSYFFCHQALQESLAALEVAGSEYDDFHGFVDEYVHRAKYIVVRQILCGVLFNAETTRLAQRQAIVPDRKKKQDLLLRTIEKELTKSVDSPMDTLNLLISLRECGGQESVVDAIKKCIPKISLSGIPLTPSDLHAAASVARYSHRLGIMQLVNCHLDGHSLEVLAEGLKGSNVEITVFDVSFNSNLRKESMFHLHEICIRGQGLNYWQCGFRQKDILMFNERQAQQEAMESSDPSDEEVIRRSFYEDKVLDLGCYNVENYRDLLNDLVVKDRGEEPIRTNVIEYEEKTDVQDLCDLLWHCKNIGEFAVSESELSEAQLKRIEDALRQKKIDALNVFLTPNIQEKGWSVLGRIAKTGLVRNIFITACSLTQVKLRGFKFSLKGATIYKLDVSRNDDMDEYCLREIGDVVEGCGVEELVMGYCNLSGEHVKYLKRNVSNGKINRIDMSGNDKMGTTGYYALGEIVLNCGVKLLDISECNPSAAEIGNFKVAKYTAKMTKLNVSRNRNMGESGLRDIGKMVGESELDELFIRQCELEEKTLRSFHRGLGDSKIRHLDFGLYFMKVRPTTDEEVEILADILPNITGQLTVNAWDINERGRRRLQDAMDNLPFVGDGVKVMFNRGKDEFIRQRQ